MIDLGIRIHKISRTEHIREILLESWKIAIPDATEKALLNVISFGLIPDMFEVSNDTRAFILQRIHEDGWTRR